MDSKDQQLFIGIEIGGTKLQLITGDVNGAIKDRLRYTINAGGGAGEIRNQIEAGITELVQNNAVKSIGVGFGGPVDWKTGAVQLSHQIEGWGNFNLKNWLNDLTGLPVAVDNDANTAALAEAKYGCGKGYTTVFYITVGSGIGGGMIINQSIYHGRTPGEVEVGHIRLDKSGMTLENKCSGWAVNKKVRQYIAINPGSVLAKLAKDSSTPEAHLLKPALEQRDADARKIIDEVADDLSFALSHVVHLFNPDIIVLGGGLSLLNNYLKMPVMERLPQYLLKALMPAPPVTIATLGEDVVPIGALELAKEALKFNREIKN